MPKTNKNIKKFTKTDLQKMSVTELKRIDKSFTKSLVKQDEPSRGNGVRDDIPYLYDIENYAHVGYKYGNDGCTQTFNSTEEPCVGQFTCVSYNECLENHGQACLTNTSLENTIGISGLCDDCLPSCLMHLESNDTCIYNGEDNYRIQDLYLLDDYNGEYDESFFNNAAANRAIIQEHIDNATIGDVVCINVGTYPILGELYLNKDGITLQGYGGLTKLWFINQGDPRPDSQEGELTYNLGSGINFVSFPLLPDNGDGNFNEANINLIFTPEVNAACEIVSIYTNNYTALLLDGTWAGSLQTITNKKGYFIHTNTSCEFTINGKSDAHVEVLAGAESSFVGYPGCYKDIYLTSKTSIDDGIQTYKNGNIPDGLVIATYDNTSGLTYTWPRTFTLDEVRNLSAGGSNLIFGYNFNGLYLAPPDIHKWWVRDTRATITTAMDPFGFPNALQVVFSENQHWCTSDDLGDCDDVQDVPETDVQAAGLYCTSGPYFYSNYECTTEDVDDESGILACIGQPVGTIVEWGKFCGAGVTATESGDTNCGTQGCTYTDSWAPHGDSLLRYGNFEIVPVNHYHSYECGSAVGACRMPTIEAFLEDGRDFIVSGWFKFGHNPGIPDEGVEPCDRITLDAGDRNFYELDSSGEPNGARPYAMEDTPGEWTYFEVGRNDMEVGRSDAHGKHAWLDIKPYNGYPGWSSNCTAQGLELFVYDIKLAYKEEFQSSTTAQWSHDKSIWYGTQELKYFEYGRGYSWIPTAELFADDYFEFSCSEFRDPLYLHGIEPSEGIIIGREIDIDTPLPAELVEGTNNLFIIPNHNFVTGDLIKIEVKIGDNMIEAYNSPYFYENQGWEPGWVDFAIRKVVGVMGNSTIQLDLPLRYSTDWDNTETLLGTNIYADTKTTMAIFDGIQISKINDMVKDVGLRNLSVSNAIFYDDAWKKEGEGQWSTMDASFDEYVATGLDLIRIYNCDNCYINNVHSTEVGDVEGLDGIGFSQPGSSEGTSPCPPYGMFTDGLLGAVQSLNDGYSNWRYEDYYALKKRNCHFHSACWMLYNTCEGQCCNGWKCSGNSSWTWCGGHNEGCNSNCSGDHHCTDNCRNYCGSYHTPKEWLIYGFEFEYPAESCSDELRLLDWLVDDMTRTEGYFVGIGGSNYSGTYSGPADNKNIENEVRQILSNGIRVVDSKNVSIKNSSMKLPEMRGEGENGKMFSIEGSSEVLVENCEGYRGRHNFSVGGWGTSGVVFSKIVSSGGWGFGIGKSFFDQIGFTTPVPARLDQYTSAGVLQTSSEVEHLLIQEASGLVSSRNHSNILWTHNDSGNPNSIFAFDINGVDKGEYVLNGTTNKDWEDIAADDTYLYIGDIGSGRGEEVPYVIYRCPEPVSTLDGDSTIDDCKKIIYTYPDGNRYNSETLMFDTNGDLYIITKEEGTTPVALYKLPLVSQVWSNLDDDDFDAIVLSFETIIPQLHIDGDLLVDELGEVTGGDIATNGNILVRTYQSVFHFERNGLSVKDALLQTDTNKSEYEVNKSKVGEQQEAVAWSDDGSLYYTLNEEAGPPSEDYFAKLGDYGFGFDLDADFYSRWKNLELLSIFFGYTAPCTTHKAMSNSVLVTDSEIYDGWFSANRVGLSGGQGITTTNSVFWNIRGAYEEDITASTWNCLMEVIDEDAGVYSGHCECTCTDGSIHLNVTPQSECDEWIDNMTSNDECKTTCINHCFDITVESQPWKRMAVPGMSTLTSYQPPLANDISNSAYENGGIIVGTQNMHVFTDVNNPNYYMDNWMEILTQWFGSAGEPGYVGYLNSLFYMLIKFITKPAERVWEEINWFEIIRGLDSILPCDYPLESCEDTLGSGCPPCKGTVADHWAIEAMKPMLGVHVGIWNMKVGNWDIDITVSDTYDFTLTTKLTNVEFDVGMEEWIGSWRAWTEDDMDMDISEITYRLTLNPVIEEGVIKEYVADGDGSVDEIGGSHIDFHCCADDFIGCFDCPGCCVVAWIVEDVIMDNIGQWDINGDGENALDIASRVNSAMGSMFKEGLTSKFVDLWNKPEILELIRFVALQTTNITLAPDGAHFDTGPSDKREWIFQANDSDNLDMEVSNIYDWQKSNNPILTHLPGCIDPDACNFDSTATIDNGNCLYVVDDCGECGGSSFETNDYLGWECSPPDVPFSDGWTDVDELSEGGNCWNIPSVVNGQFGQCDCSGTPAFVCCTTEYEDLRGTIRTFEYSFDDNPYRCRAYEPSWTSCSRDMISDSNIYTDWLYIPEECCAAQFGGDADDYTTTECVTPEGTTLHKCILTPSGENIYTCTEDECEALDSDGDGICDSVENIGCTDENATNYDGSATLDDDSCVYHGCIDPLAACGNPIYAHLAPCNQIGQGGCSWYCQQCGGNGYADCEVATSWSTGKCEYWGCSIEYYEVNNATRAVAMNYDANATHCPPPNDGSSTYDLRSCCEFKYIPSTEPHEVD